MVQYDVIIVLGNPATEDGEPGAIMTTRVEKAVELFNQKLANKIIVSGNAVYNQFNEAVIMSELARSLGVPATAIIKETVARNSYENAKLAVDILNANNWTRALVITSPYHLKRASYIFSHYDIDYKIVVANYPKGFSTVNKLIYNLWETWLLTKLYLFGDRRLPLAVPKR
ncbi:MAG TPA: YdcF family protein [Cyanobacteria bacterium UBA12227]|nr:YdcF family protein [Cyanobacteria bacterium UBA12227]HAX86060.1 YdcF family protein [Cyanobacteria bacterium UBA11370]HBY79179.1 YdcF family protein [Cyanobacteria bacterium UBA11148]